MPPAVRHGAQTFYWNAGTDHYEALDVLPELTTVPAGKEPAEAELASVAAVPSDPEGLRLACVSGCQKIVDVRPFFLISADDRALAQAQASYWQTADVASLTRLGSLVPRS